MNEREVLLNKLNSETSKIAWSELQTFFAAGQVVFLEKGLDLIAMAAEFSLDNKALLAPLIEQGKMGVVNETLAQQWLNNNQQVWAVVVAPWILVQAV